MLTYTSIDSELTNSAKVVLLHHTWYLQIETVPMDLFSDKLSLDEKSTLSATIMTFESSRLLNWNRVTCETNPEEGGY